MWSLVRGFRLDLLPGPGDEVAVVLRHGVRYVSRGTLDDDMVQSRSDFYYLAGFCITHFKEDNWRGSGVLVDIADPVLPHLPQWQQGSYGQKVKKEDGVYDLE